MFSRSMGTPNDHRQRRNRIYQDEKEGQNSDFEVTELLKWMCLDTPLQLFNFPQSGRGLKTPKAIGKGENLIAIPIQKLMTRKMLETRFPSHYSTHLMLTSFLIQESSLNECSKWKTYLKSLPKTYDVPYFDLTQDHLDHCPAYLKPHFQSQFDLVQRNFQASNFQDLDLFAWAWFTVNTRGVYFQDGFDNLALAPFLDMFNHDWSVQVQSKVLKNSFYVLVAETETQAEQQVFINYGPHDNLKLYLEYGFVLSQNPHDAIQLELEDLIVDFDNDQKMFIRNHNLNCKLQILPNEEIVSWSILACLFIAKRSHKDLQAVFYQDLEVHQFKKEVIEIIMKVKNELLQALESSCQSSKILPSLLRIHLNICQSAMEQI